MVQVSSHVVAFWDEFSRGTAHAIACAANAGKLRAVYGATGKELPIEDAVRIAFKVCRRRPNRGAIAPEIRRLSGSQKKDPLDNSAPGRRMGTLDQRSSALHRDAH